MVMGGSVLYEFSIGRPILTQNLLVHFFGTPCSHSQLYQLDSMKFVLKTLRHNFEIISLDS